jgi:hypothetical protein
MNPVAVAIYSLVTYIPKWFTENEITRNRRVIIILIVIWIIVSILNYVTNIRPT